MNNQLEASSLSLLIDYSKFLILLLQIVAAALAVWLSILLTRSTEPLATKLAQLHQDGTIGHSKADQYLSRIRDRYINLLAHVDNVDTAEFGAGVIETISLPFFARSITAAAAQGWLRQAPGILISLGLLGTFAGLTAGLTEISGALESGATTTATITALSGIIAPMGAAFQTSLLGLFLSLVILVWTQVTGTRTCLERCEALLSSWLETVLPLELGDKVITPLRQSIQDLNATTKSLPMAICTAIEKVIGEAFADQLDQVFDFNATLAAEAQTTVRQLSTVANALNESGQDFVQAAQAFRDTDFAITLQNAVKELSASSVQLTSSTDRLSTRLLDVRDGLISTQSEWQLLAKTAELELETCRIVGGEIKSEIKTLQQAGINLELGTEATREASKQLRETRLEVMRDRKLAIQVAESVQSRLAVDSSSAESCKVFASSLETALSNWNRNVERLDGLAEAFVASVQQSKLEGEEMLAERRELVRQNIVLLEDQLQGDLNIAIQHQHTVLSNMGEQMVAARNVSEALVKQLDGLQYRLTANNSLAIQNSGDTERGS